MLDPKPGELKPEWPGSGWLGGELPAVGVIDEPHSAQNRAVGVTAFPHCGHNRTEVNVYVPLYQILPPSRSGCQVSVFTGPGTYRLIKTKYVGASLDLLGAYG